MTGLFQIAASTLRRSIRNRTFVLLGIVAPFLIMAALSATIGSALAGEYRPSLVIVDESGGAVPDRALAGLRDSGFDDVVVAGSLDAARQAVEAGDADAAIVLPSDLADPAAVAPIVRVIADAESEVAIEIASAIGEQFSSAGITMRLLTVIGAPPGDQAGPISIVDAADVGSSVLTDATYFAVGMSSFFAFFTTSVFLASYHQEREQSTLARMLLAPIGRLTPIMGQGIGVGVLMLASYATLVGASTLLLGADWGPLPGVIVIGLALVFTAVAVAMAVVALTKTEEAATQTGMVIAVGWAVFGGVFVEIPATGPLATGARLSPFTWAVEAIGLNAGTGSFGEVFIDAMAIAAFGMVGLVVVSIRRRQLVGP